LLIQPTEKLISDIRSTANGLLGDFYANDQETIEVHLLKPNPDSTSDLKYIYEAISGSLAVALGLINTAPTAGTFTLTDPDAPQTTSALAYNITASALQTALRAKPFHQLCQIAQLRKLQTEYLKLTALTQGAIDALTADADGLSPEAYIGISTVREGDGSYSEIQIISLNQAPVALVDSGWLALPNAAVTVTETQEGGTGANAIFEVSINDDAYDGSFTLTCAMLDADNNQTRTSLAIDYDSSAADFKTAVDTGWQTDNEVTVTKMETGRGLWNLLVTILRRPILPLCPQATLPI
jgi:hypothetical protein